VILSRRKTARVLAQDVFRLARRGGERVKERTSVRD
jgi:hypothetical protein